MEKTWSNGAYLEEDLGDTTLYEFLSKNRNGEGVASPVVEAYPISCSRCFLAFRSKPVAI